MPGRAVASMAAAVPRIPGWYGKIPNLGDFTSRRLPSRFLSPWDEWLQRAIAASQATLGDAWRDIYLTSPFWRFLCMPGACGDSAWAGVIMPSVDRIGRYFPLTIAAELTSFDAREPSWHALSQWLGDIERVALEALDVTHSAEDLEAALHAVPIPSFAPDEDAPADLLKVVEGMLGVPTLSGTTLSSLELLAPVLGGVAGAMLRAAAFGKTIWWSGNKEGLLPLLLCCDGLPPYDDFVVLLTGTPKASAAPHPR